MKQHITGEQLNELSVKGKKKLLKWWKPKWHDIFIFTELGLKELHIHSDEKLDIEPRNMLWTNYKQEGEYVKKHRLKGYILPILSIGQMIEFLDEHVHNFELRGGRMNKSYLADIPDNTMVWHGWSQNLEIEDEPVLCDALWEAVKDVLENI